MSQLGEVGISPVLLQAISQSITATSQNRNPANTLNMESTNGGGNSQLPTQRDSSDKYDEKLGVKTMLKIKMAANALTKGILGDGDKSSYAKSSISDLAMANMLTALATQAGGTSLNMSDSGSQSGPGLVEDSGVSETLQQKQFLRTSTGELVQQVKDTNDTNTFLNDCVIKTEIDISGGNASTSSMNPDVQTAQLASELLTKTVNFNVDNMGTDSQSKYIIKSTCADQTMSQSIPTQSLPMTLQISSQEPVQPGHSLQSNMDTEPVQNVVDTMLSFPQSSGQMIEFDGKRYILTAPSSVAGGNKYIAIQTSPGPSTSEDADVYTTVGGHEVVSEVASDGMAVGLSAMQAYPGGEGEPASNCCPICGDEISGFHYGIFTCESCKGFFKRTVQNKKSFVCHRQGECEITLENRKKCPACRFAKCLVMGMNLTAIRQDRSRGGRSSYSGLSSLDESKRKRMKQIPKRPVASTSTSSDSRLASALSKDFNQTFGKPFVPTVLTDIMNLESLLCDDDIPPNIKADDFISTNPSVFLTLLQLCELKLYKIVRWARNLPYFANISTDDQILLLQNCWCELLGLTMCWKSIHLTNEIVFFHGQTIDLEKAKLLNLGDMFMCLLAEVEQLKRLKLDQYECVAMKVIILITPDIKGLNDSERLGLQQQKISEALEQYTSSHYKQHPSKYGELLLRLPELSRISFMLKEQLLSWMPLDNTSCGLLYELLKGENMKELL